MRALLIFILCLSILQVQADCIGTVSDCHRTKSLFERINEKLTGYVERKIRKNGAFNDEDNRIEFKVEKEIKRLKHQLELDRTFLQNSSTSLISFNEHLFVWREKALKNIEKIQDLKKDNPENIADEAEKLVEDFIESSKEFPSLMRGYLDIIERLKDRKDLSEEEKEQLLISAKASLATSLMMYENTLLAMTQLKGIDSIHLQMAKSDLKRIHALREKFNEHIKMISETVSKETFVDIFNVIEHSEDTRQKISKDEQYLDGVIQRSVIKNDLRRYVMDDKKGPISQFFSALWNGFTQVLSKLFGNATGAISWGEGKMKSMPEEKKESIEKKLKPLDILMDKTTFKLTDKVIPGHFGHVAIWVGSEEELKEIGMWDDPLIKPHQEEIRKGKKIIEALRPGVQMSSLDEFMNIDDMAVISNDSLTLEQKKRFLKNAFSNVGKDYDFNFDIATEDKIYCSELVYHVFEDYSWPHSKTLDRATMSPDQVAKKALTDPDFRFKLFYHDGKEVPQADIAKEVKELMEG